MSTSARRRIGPETWSGRTGGSGGTRRSEAGFWRGPSGWSRTIRRFRQERDGLIERIKERIAGIYRELQALPEKIRAVGERVKAWEKEQDREWVHGGGYERARAERTAQITKKYSHAAGPQISNTPRSPQPTRGHERDVGPSR